MGVPEDFSDRSVGAQAHLAQAYAHERIEEFEMALRECERALQLDPSLAEAHNLRGILLEELGRKRSAISAYRRALELDPSFEEARQNLHEAEVELETAAQPASAPPPLPLSWVDSSDLERLRIDTPENVVFDYRVAGIGSRFLAALIDTILMIILQIIASLTLSFLVRELVPREVAWLRAWMVALFGLIAFALFWGYYVFFEVTWNGQSPGKRRVGLRVIRIDGTPISLAESVIRNLIRLIDFLPLYYAIGLVTMFVNQQSRRLGDLAAGTLVVYDREAVTLESLAPDRSLPRTSWAGVVAKGDWPIERLTDQDIQLAEDFLRRRDELVNSGAIAGRIAQVLLGRMGVTADQVGLMSGEDVILKVARAIRRRETD